MKLGKSHIFSFAKSDLVSDYCDSKKKINASGHLCHAPFSSMRFTISGNIHACCYNRLLLLGKYPENSLYDTWNSEQSHILKSSILKKDLRMGCGYCSEVIKTGNFHAVGARNYDYLTIPENNWPTMLDFELGNNCNLECIMCNGENSALIRKNRENETPYSPPYDDEFVKQLEPFIPHLKEARFVGGEPFLIEINYKIWEKIIELNPNCNIIVLTNGTVLTDRIKEFIAKGNFDISISSDGISKEVYEKIRINADFSVFMNNLRFLIDYSKSKNKSFSWNLCPQRLNWHEIPEIFSFCNNENTTIYLHTIIFPPHTALWNLPIYELEKIKKDLVKKKPSFNRKNKIQKENEELYTSFIHQIENWMTNNSKAENTTDLNSVELKNKLYSKISVYISETKVFSDEFKTELIKSYTLKLDNIFELLDNKSLIRVLTFMLSFNIELMTAEIANSSFEKLKQRILTAAM